MLETYNEKQKTPGKKKKKKRGRWKEGERDHNE